MNLLFNDDLRYDNVERISFDWIMDEQFLKIWIILYFVLY
jgi:hypothetical protein